MIEIALAVAAICWTGNALAAPRVFRSITATVVYNSSTYLSAPANIRIKAVASTTGVDPVLNVLDPSGNTIAFNDDAPGLGLNSEVSFPITVSGWYRIIVHSYTASSGGTGTVFLDTGGGYTTYATGASFRGTKLTTSASTRSFQTALRPGGTDDTVIYMLDLYGQVLAWDDDQGTGLASFYWNLVGTVPYVVLGAYSTPGTADLYLNDADGSYTNDHDNDGLGRDLELQLGSCDDYYDPGCAYVFNLRDSDHDGIEDRYELFGLDYSPPIELPRWGASPVVKDVFIEEDYAAGFSLTSSQMQTCADMFATGPQSQVRNLIGDGVRLHFDVGPSAICSDPALCGNWGGGTATASPSMNSQRTNIFVHAYVRPGDLDTGPTAVPMKTAADPFCHELGHHLNLSHEAGPLLPSPHPFTTLQANCKPNYKSIMNYGMGGVFVLSKGYEADMNPSHVSEVNHYSSSTDTSLLAAAFPRNASAPWQLDWNRDQKYADGPSGHVRAGLTHMKQACNGGGIYAKQVVIQPAAVTPDLVTYPHDAAGTRRLYAFFVQRADNRLYYMHGSMSGATSSGSCGPTGPNPCHVYDSPLTVSPVPAPVKSVSVEDWGGRLAVAYLDNTSTIRVVTGTRDGTGTDGGNLAWSAPRTIVPGVDNGTEPELAVLRVAPGGQYGSVNEVLALFYVKGGIHQMTFTDWGYVNWSPGAALLESGTNANIAGSLAASVVAWPPRGSLPWPDYSSDPALIARNCAVLPNANRIARFYCYDRASNRWANYSTGFDNAGANIKLIGRPALGYHVLRTNVGTSADPLVQTSGNTAWGQFWFVGVPDVPTDADAHRNPVYWVTFKGREYPSTPPTYTMGWTSMTEWRDDWSHAFWDDATGQNSGFSFYEDGNLSALKAAWNPSADWFEIEPFADGTADIDLHDISDFKVLERGICAAVRGPTAGDAFCGSVYDSYWGY